jgi:hypothetical protein
MPKILQQVNCHVQQFGQAGFTVNWQFSQVWCLWQVEILPLKVNRTWWTVYAVCNNTHGPDVHIESVTQRCAQTAVVDAAAAAVGNVVRDEMASAAGPVLSV